MSSILTFTLRHGGPLCSHSNLCALWRSVLSSLKSSIAAKLQDVIFPVLFGLLKDLTIFNHRWRTCQLCREKYRRVNNQKFIVKAGIMSKNLAQIGGLNPSSSLLQRDMGLWYDPRIYRGTAGYLAETFCSSETAFWLIIRWFLQALPMHFGALPLHSPSSLQ